MALYSRFKIMVLCALFQAAAAAESPSFEANRPCTILSLVGFSQWRHACVQVETFEVVSGSCTVKSDKCVYSDNFGPGQKYSDNQDCVIKQNVPFPLVVRSFDVEAFEAHSRCAYDFLKVNGEVYCGTKGPNGVTPAAGSELVWHTDGSVTSTGFKICAPGDMFACTRDGVPC